MKRVVPALILLGLLPTLSGCVVAAAIGSKEKSERIYDAIRQQIGV
jgi:hypothetical protein